MHYLATHLNTGGGSYIDNPSMFFLGLALIGLFVVSVFRKGRRLP